MPVLTPGLDEERLAARDLPQGLPQRELQRRHDARDDDVPRRLAPRRTPASERPRTDSAISSAVASRRVVSRQWRASSAVLVEAEDRVRVADVHGEERARRSPRSPLGHLPVGDDRLARRGLQPQEPDGVEPEVLAR